jgi:NitT/TauT family transport system substrate-binding protein
MHRLIFPLILLIFSAVIGCDNASTTTTAGTSTPTEVRLGFFPNVTHAQAVLGVTSGDFEKAVAPVRFTPQQFNAGPALIEALFDHRIDVGYVGPGPAINGFSSSHGKGIRIISGAAANGVLIVARKDSGITTMADLKGKKIATPQHRNTQDIAARHYFTAVLGQGDTDNILPVNNADQFSMMMQGNIDAAWVPEPWGSLLISQAGAHLVGQEKDLWPDREFSLTVIVTTPEFLAAHADVLQKLLAVNRDWTNRLTTNPADCIPKLEAGLAQLAGKPLPPGVVADSVSHVKFTEEPLPATLKANADWAFELGFSKDKIDLTDLVDLSVQKKLPVQRTNP